MKIVNTTQEWSPIAIVGVGGAGCNLVLKHQMHATPSNPPIQHLAVNTDRARILGIHTMPAILLRADASGVEALEPWLTPCHTLYVLAGLGGRAGSAAAPALVHMARGMGLHTVALVSTPFEWEGSRREARAEQALRAVYVQAHEFVLVNSERAVQHLGDDCTMKDMFDCLDAEVLRELEARVTR